MHLHCHFAVASEALLFPSFCKDKWHEMTAHGVCGIWQLDSWRSEWNWPIKKLGALSPFCFFVAPAGPICKNARASDNKYCYGTFVLRISDKCQAQPSPFHFLEPQSKDIESEFWSKGFSSSIFSGNVWNCQNGQIQRHAAASPAPVIWGFGQRHTRSPPGAGWANSFSGSMLNHSFQKANLDSLTWYVFNLKNNTLQSKAVFK